jgi:uncharacterized protein (DUF362 family)
MPDVAIVHDDDIERAIGEALTALDLGDLIGGRVVAVKPNETWASKEDRTGVTQPETLRAVLRHFKSLAPSRLVVSGGAGAGETDEILRISGMADVVRDEAVDFVDHNRPPFETVELDYGDDREVQGPQRKVVVHAPVLGYEVLVSLAQLKLHDTATVTLALKNVAMSYPAADHYGHPRGSGKGRHFFDDMHSFIAAMARRFPIGLAIIVGHPAMIATGPLGGFPVETGLVIASRDPLAADVVGARLLGFNVQAVRHLWEAGRLGLGETDTDAMTFVRLGLDQAIRIFTQRAYGRELTFEHA